MTTNEVNLNSEYLEPFKKAAPHFKISGNKILVERIELGEVKTAGGIILAESNNVRSDLRLQKPHLATVIAVGEGYFDAETNSYTPLDVKVGNIVILNSFGVQYFSVLFGSTNYANSQVGITTEADVQITFEDKAAFEAYSAAIKG